MFWLNNDNNPNKQSSPSTPRGYRAGYNKITESARVLVEDGARMTRMVDYDSGGTVLFKAIEQRQWKSVLSRLTMCPHEVSTFVYRVDHSASSSSSGEKEEEDLKFQYVSLPLHAALLHKPPRIIVSTLIAAYPKAVSRKCGGDLPLHIALKHGSGLECIEHLILAYPKSLKVDDSNGDRPLKVFQQNIMSWTDDDEKEKIKKVLTKGVKHIVVDGDENENGGVEEGQNPDAKKLSLTSSLQEEGWLKVSYFDILGGKILV